MVVGPDRTVTGELLCMCNFAYSAGQAGSGRVRGPQGAG